MELYIPQCIHMDMYMYTYVCVCVDMHARTLMRHYSHIHFMESLKEPYSKITIGTEWSFSGILKSDTSLILVALQYKHH